MKRCIFLLTSLMLATCLLLSACSFRPSNANVDNVENSASVYYISLAGSELVAETVALPDVSRKKQLSFLITQLIKPPAGKISPLNDGTELLSAFMRDDVAVVDFSAAFAKKDDLKQTLAPAAVAKTLCSLDFVSGVQILVEGKEALGADGKPFGIIRESDLVINKGSEPSLKPETTLLLYFSDENSEYLVPERRYVDISGGDPIEKRIVEELIKGPAEMGHVKTIPSEVKLLSIETKDNVCFVNLSKDFIDKHSGGTTGEKLTVFSIVNSLTELGTIDRVQFLIEGEKREEFIHMTFNEPILRNKNWIKE